MDRRMQIYREDYDSQEEYEDALAEKKRKGSLPTAVRRGGVKAKGDGGDAPAIPEPVVFEDTVRSWASEYTAVATPDANTEFWTIGDIRESLFGMVPFGNLDPLEKLKNILEECGLFAVSNPAYGGVVYQLKRDADILIKSDGSIVEMAEELSLY